MPFKTLPTALETRELAGVHSFQPVTPTTTLALALERWSSTPEIPIPQSALQRCCSTLPAHRTRPLELARLFLTIWALQTPPLVSMRSQAMTLGTPIRLSVYLRFQIMSPALKTLPSAVQRFLATWTAATI